MESLPLLAPARTPVRTALWLRIEGMDSALLAGARMPNLNALRRRGTWSWDAEATDGVDARVGAIDAALAAVFQAARCTGRRTALIAGSRELRQWIAPAYLDSFAFPGTTPWSVAQETASLLRNDRPHLCVVQLATPEIAACRYGWGSSEQCQALEECDAALAAVLRALDRVAPRGETLLVVTGHRGCPREPFGPFRGLPWICAGPGVPVGREIRLPLPATVTTELLSRALALAEGSVAEHRGHWSFIGDLFPIDGEDGAAAEEGPDRGKIQEVLVARPGIGVQVDGLLLGLEDTPLVQSDGDEE
jgi:hypothetical protein